MMQNNAVNSKEKEGSKELRGDIGGAKAILIHRYAAVVGRQQEMCLAFALC